MKVLQINCVYKKGSTGKIVYDIHSSLNRNGISSVVCYGRGEHVNENGVYKTCGEFYSKINHFITRLNGIMYAGCNLSTNKLIAVIKREQPDIVHLHCINGYFVNIYRLVKWLRDNEIKTVLTLHAEFMYTGGCGHAFDCNQWKTSVGCGNPECPRWRTDTESMFFDGTKKMWHKMKRAFEGFDDNLIVTSVSPWLMQRAKKSVILGAKTHKTVLNGLDTNVFCEYQTNELKSRIAAQGEKIIFHASPNFNSDKMNIKGGYYLIELAKRMLDENVKFVVAGPHPQDISVPENVILLGMVKDQKELAKYYCMADVTLLTSQKETYSMVTAESLCCGTPIVGFKAGAPEMIALPEYSSFVEYGDVDALYDAVTNVIKSEKQSNIAKRAKEVYDKEIMTQAYFKIYQELLG